MADAAYVVVTIEVVWEWQECASSAVMVGVSEWRVEITYLQTPSLTTPMSGARCGDISDQITDETAGEAQLEHLN